MCLTIPPAAPAPAPPAPPTRNDRFAGRCSLRLWLDSPYATRRDELLVPEFDNVQWKTHGAVYWLEVIEPTVANLLRQIDTVVPWSIGYHQLVGSTLYGTRVLLDDPEEPLLLSEMILITGSWHVRMWLGQSPPCEPMDFLFRFHRDPNDKGTPVLSGQTYRARTNRGQPEAEEEEDKEEEDLEENEE